jgi:hypothetical protein
MKRAIVVLLHTGYWAAYLLLLAFLLALARLQYRGDPSQLLMLFGMMGLVPSVLAFYWSYRVLFPLALAPRRFGILALGAGLGCAGAIGVTLALLYVTRGSAAPPFSRGTAGLTVLAILLSPLALMHMMVALVLRGFVGWYGDLKVKEELARKQWEMETALVRSKIDPHFLFNTLNNVDVLILKDPATASVYLNKLCDIMRFVLYEARAETIPLADELAYIEKYIGLEQIRTANSEYVSYTVTGDTKGLMITPMIFIPFIENAFKHGESRKQDGAVEIRVVIEGGRVEFDCRNRYRPNPVPASDHRGLGHELMRRRLALLYPNRHTFDITDRDNVYHVHLTIDLHDHPVSHR